VLGLERADGAGAQIADSALQAAPADLIDPHAALYGTPGLSVLVIAARAHTSFPSRQIDSFRKGFEGAGRSTLTDGRNVKTGHLGGAARCWLAHLNGTTPGVCIFVDRGSLVATIDFLPGGVEEAAKRGLQIREATVHKA
jgi:enoyl-[acyl-carrier-protein] reductase (NADH)